MHTKTLAELSKGLQDREFSAVELTQHYIDRIHKHDGQFNSFVTVCEDQALEQAKQADKQLANGTAGPLTGIPMAHKDIFCTQGIKTACGSKMLDNFISPYSATVVENLHQAGMVMLGKTNMDEFAMGSSNETSYYGTVHNPWNRDCVPGGSSGGSAASVAARLVPCATGTDTGGSIRQPAAFCGITGLKPTYGRVSRFGMIAFASSLDQAGPMTATAEDAAYVLGGMAGHDPRDSTCANVPVPDYVASLSQSLKGKKVGLPKEYFDDLPEPMRRHIDKALSVFQDLGVEIKEVSLPDTTLSVPTYYIVAPAECSSNLSRFDGVRYGYRCENPTDLKDLYTRSRGEAFGEEVKRRIMTGTYVLSAGYYDAYYLKAQQIRQKIAHNFKQVLTDVDCIIAPTTPTAAFKIGEKTSDPVSMYLSDIYTIAANLAGLPGISIPMGFEGTLPVGLQLIGNHFAEETILAFAHQYQQQTDWHKQCPAGL
jgi:aspartyl-tRNA(Asn)/glutamyl-tRNA(Gln) amidotransferase subunit A